MAKTAPPNPVITSRVWVIKKTMPDIIAGISIYVPEWDKYFLWQPAASTETEINFATRKSDSNIGESFWYFHFPFHVHDLLSAVLLFSFARSKTSNRVKAQAVP